WSRRWPNNLATRKSTTIPASSPGDRFSIGVLAPDAKLRSKIVPAPAEPAPETSSEDAQAQSAPAFMSWARLLKRVFDIDIEHCPNCGALKKPPTNVSRRRRSL